MSKTARTNAEKPDEKAAHTGHRARMYERIDRDGFYGLADYELLEVLLFAVVPRADTRLLAHRLIAHFGTYHRIFEATDDELRAVEGVGPSVSRYLRLLGTHEQRVRADRTRYGMRNVPLNTAERIREYVLPQFISAREERILLITLDYELRPISSQFISEGGVDGADLDPRAVLTAASRDKAAAVLLAHNHPRGDAVPSHDDIRTTEKLIRLLDSVGVTLYEHLIVTEHASTGMIERGWCTLPPPREPHRR